MKLVTIGLAFVLLLTSLLMVQPVSAAIVPVTFEAVATGFTETQGTSLTVSMTGSGDSTGLLVVMIFRSHDILNGPTETALTVTSSGVTFRELTSTRDPDSSFVFTLDTWYAVGFIAFQDITITAADTSRPFRTIYAAVTRFSNVDQTSPFGAAGINYASTSQDTCTDTSTTVTPRLSGNIVLDGFAFGTGTETAGTGQTVTWNINGADGLFSGSRVAVTSVAPQAMTWESSASSSTCLQTAMDIKSRETTEGNGGPPGGGLPSLPSDLNAVCPLSPLDWLVAQPVTGHRDITVYDGRSEAALAILYIISWGDGKQDTKATTPVNHTYGKDGIYTLTVRVQYRTGLIEVYVTQVDTRGNNCALQKFANEYIGILLMLAVLLVIAAVIVTASRRRVSSKKRELFRKAFVWLGIGILAIVLAIVVYATLAGIPI